jgi:5'-3' exonuclease
MGIPNYFMYIVKEYRDVIKGLNYLSEIQNFYIDGNSIIYDAVHKLLKDDVFNDLNNDKFEKEILKEVANKINEYIAIIKPTNNILITFDGIAPVSKLKQQRQRRYKSNYERRELMGEEVRWNTTAITPGTNFMKKLNQHIHKQFKNHKKFKVKKLMISDSSEIGEGEHKIFEYMRNYKDEHEGMKTVIYGLDADLIMLSLNHLRVCADTYLFRETPHFIQSVDKTLQPNANYVIDIPYFAEVLSKSVGNKTERCDDFILDYVFLCFFLGNDFLPHFPALNIRTEGIFTLLEAYKTIIAKRGLNLVKNEKILWKNVRIMIEFLGKNEAMLLKEEYKRRDAMAERIMKRLETNEDVLNSMPMIDREMEEFINPWKDGWEKRFYGKLFDTKINEFRLNEICKNYMEGLEWTQHYYVKGCKNWRWSYHYDYAPLLKDLIHYLPYYATELVKPNNKHISNEVQLCYVLPRVSLNLLPKNIEDSVKDKKWYTDNGEYVWAFCRYLWEAHVRLPTIRINEIEEVIENIETV